MEQPLPYNYVIYFCEGNDSRCSNDLLLSCASDYTGLPIQNFRRIQEEGQKPRLEGPLDLHFSVSHSGNYWMCAFGPSPVGLDLQQHRSCRCEALARRFFHPDEIQWMEENGFTPQHFYDFWTAKESYVKLTGRGLGQGLSTFSVVPPLPDTPQWRHIPFLKEYSLCLCADRIDHVKIQKMTEKRRKLF